MYKNSTCIARIIRFLCNQQIKSHLSYFINDKLKYKSILLLAAPAAQAVHVCLFATSQLLILKTFWRSITNPILYILDLTFHFATHSNFGAAHAAFKMDMVNGVFG